MAANELTVMEAAAVLGLDPSVIRRRIRLGEMQARRVGARLWLIPAAEVERQRMLGRRRSGPKPRKEQQ